MACSSCQKARERKRLKALQLTKQQTLTTWRNQYPNAKTLVSQNIETKVDIIETINDLFKDQISGDVDLVGFFRENVWLK